MSRKQKEYKYHYTYRITNIVEKKYYYGVHSCNCLPKEDIGVKYFSSSKNKAFKDDIKENPQNYKYKVVKIFDTRKEALEHEIFLHTKFNVKLHKSFYNDSNQTSIGRDTTGMCSVKDKDGNTFLVPIDDPRYLSGELVGVSKGVKMPKEFGEKISRKNKGKIPTVEHRENLSKALTGKKKSKEHIQKGVDTKLANGTYKGKNHPRFKGYYVTPMGTFDSPAALIPIITLTQMKIYCNDCSTIITPKAYNKSRFLQLFYAYDDIKDKTYEDLGFWRDYI